ncbi:MAG: class I SAM-dependent rRNA methyltransferase [Chloroflexi bacterium]|nr:class I SAM-dependent rRNA methyltransferase [Chloroflexota bacterium]
MVVLKPGKEKPALQRHPWIFSGAISQVQGDPADGSTVTVVDHNRQFLAQGYLNRLSQITVRLLSWNPDEAITPQWWHGRLRHAVEGREALRRRDMRSQRGETNAYRLVHSEADGLPGLIVDQYADFLVVQFLTLGVDVHKNELVTSLAELLQPLGIYERSDDEVRHKEGLPLTTGPLLGLPPDRVEILESGLKFEVDLVAGQKTGFYLDQRENRWRVAQYCQHGKVLNAFSYSGAFAVYCAHGGAASVLNIDTSADALAMGQRNLAKNALGSVPAEHLNQDVFHALRLLRDRGEVFDLIILDPPKFAYSQSQVESAARGYKDINLLAMKLLRPGGILATFSCSGAIDSQLFQRILFGASVDAGREVQILERLSQAADHPVLLTFPESEYLKGCICRIN